jgi:hypothetical protein
MAGKRERGECKNCSDPVSTGSKSFCDAHLVADRRAKKQYADNKKAAGVCVDCKSPVSPASSRYCEKHRLSLLAKYRTRKYGVSPALVTGMLVKQNGACAICEDKPVVRALGLDHNHITNVARGLLCDPCNLGISKLKDNPSIILRAAQYVLSSGFHA